MDVSDWEAIAAWWDAKIGEDGDLWHRSLIDPGLLRLVGDVSGLRMLDLGCGNGYLSRRLARQGARVVGIDASRPVLALAQEREERAPLGVVYHHADAAHLPMLEDGSFDLCIANMSLMDITDGAGAIGEVGRVLKPGGRFVATLSHPCFDISLEDSVWTIDWAARQETVWRKVRRYREPHVVLIPWRAGPAGATLATEGYHRPLSWYVRAYRAAGLAIVAIDEPSPGEEMLAESPLGGWVRDIVPLHCAVEAIRLPGVLRPPSERRE